MPRARMQEDNALARGDVIEQRLAKRGSVEARMTLALIMTTSTFGNSMAAVLEHSPCNERR